MTMILNKQVEASDINDNTIQVSSNPDELAEVLSKKITNEAASMTGLKKVSTFGLEIRDDNNTLIAGLSGYEFYGSLVIDILWVDSPFRRKGLGSRLLVKLEELAKQRHIKFISVSTMEFWNSVKFYEKHGFQLEFIRDGFDNGYKQFHLIRKIS